MALKQGNLYHAAQHYEMSLEIAKKLELPLPLIFAWYSMGELHEAKQELILAEDAYTEAKHYAEVAEHQQFLAICNTKLQQIAIEC
jgi:hypothetical protein